MNKFILALIVAVLASYALAFRIQTQGSTKYGKDWKDDDEKCPVKKDDKGGSKGGSKDCTCGKCDTCKSKNTKKDDCDCKDKKDHDCKTCKEWDTCDDCDIDRKSIIVELKKITQSCNYIYDSLESDW
jgi:hypothetical protein